MAELEAVGDGLEAKALTARAKLAAGPLELGEKIVAGCGVEILNGEACYSCRAVSISRAQQRTERLSCRTSV
jgi:hypothetical protein